MEKVFGEKELKSWQDRNKVLEEVIVPNLLAGVELLMEELEEYKPYLSEQEYNHLKALFQEGTKDLVQHLE